MPISNAKDLVELFGTTLYETDDAVMLDFGEVKGDWVPKALMEDWPDIGESGDVLIQEWFAKKEGFI